jgi:hypothetical protein
MSESWARARCGITCGCEEACPSLEERAERRRDEWDGYTQSELDDGADYAAADEWAKREPPC